MDLFKPQLFLDDTWIAQSAFVSRQWHQARKFPEPVLKAEHPWEQWCPLMYGTVLQHDGLFKMWYCVWTRGEYNPRVCYAQSLDGVVWEKPFLGLCEYEGSKENNIVLDSNYGRRGLIDDISVIVDEEDHEWPLKALYWDVDPDNKEQPWAIYAARSHDGIYWDRTPGQVLPNWGDRFNAVASKVDGKYLLFGRAEPRYFQGRSVWRVESDDLMQWSEPELVLTQDVEDSPSMQYYSVSAFPYSDLLIGGLERMWMTPDRLDTEIMWSRDAGRHWQRSRTRPCFIPWGHEQSWDSTWINLPSNSPIVHQNRLWFYYSGRSVGHNLPYPLNHGAIGLAVLRIDGFASLYAAEYTGSVLTPPLEWPDAHLYLNVDPRRDLSGHPTFQTGEVAVEVRDESGKPIEGFTWDDCTPLRSNTAGNPDASAIVKWGERSMRELAGRRLQLAIRLRDAHLYSFRAVIDS